MTTIQKYASVFYPREGEGEQSILISKRNSLLFLTGLWSRIFRTNIFPSLQPSTNSFLPSPPQRVPSLPYLAVLALCCQLFQFGSGVSSYAHFCYHSGRMSSHKFGTDGASLLGVEGRKNIPRITKLGIKTSSTKKPIILF